MIVFIGVFSTGFFWRKLFVKVVAGYEAIVSGKIVEEAVVVGALAILKTFELNLPRLLFFGVVDLLASIGEVAEAQMIENIELKSPDNVGGVFDVAAFFETLEGYGLSIILAIETADDEKGRVGVALKFLELTNGIINAEFGSVF